MGFIARRRPTLSPKRVDTNQSEIVAALRQAGCTVQHLHELGQGCPDIVVGCRGRNYLLEIKSSSEAKLTPHELWWHKVWKGQVARVDTVDEALAVVRW